MNNPYFYRRCIAWEPIVAAAGTAAAAGISAAGSIGGAALRNKKQYQFWQKQFNEQMHYDDFLRNYNLPVNQMQRYKDAGLNPNLVASSSVGNTASGHSVPDIPSPEPYDFTGFGNGVQQAISQYYEVASILKQRELQDQQIAESRAREKSYDALASLNTAKSAIEFLRGDAYKDNDYFGNLTRTTAQKLISSVYQNGILSENLDFLMKSHPLLLEGYRRSNSLTSARTRNVNADTELKNQKKTWLNNTYDNRFNLLNNQVQRFAHLNKYTDNAAFLSQVQAGLISQKINEKYLDKVFDFGLGLLGTYISKGTNLFKRGSSSNYSGFNPSITW